MRVFAIIVLSSVLGMALGIGSTLARFDWSLDPPDPLASDADQNLPNPRAVGDGPPPEVKVDHEEHDFGAIEANSTVRHAFRFTNAGQGILELRKGGTTCGKCTIAELPKEQLAPGESEDVIVEYHAPDDKVFRQSATILLPNDPKRSRVALTITGKVATQLRVMPGEIVLSKISASETRTAEVRLFAYFTDDLQVLGHEFSDPKAADFFAVAVTPLDAAELKREPETKSGCRVLLTIKPGLPIGPVSQKLLLKTNILDPNAKDGGGNREITIPISGSVEGDISIGGRDWLTDPGVLTLGLVKSSAGAQRRLFLTVRGPERREVRIKVGQIVGAGLRAVIGEPVEINGGAVIQMPLLVEVAPGTDPVAHLGSAQGRMGRIYLETTHSHDKQIVLHVQYAVER